MPRRCTICIHSNRNAIETEVHRGTPFRNIALQFQVTASSVFRHRSHITPTAQQAEVSAVNSNGNGHKSSVIIPEVMLEAESEQDVLPPQHQLFVDAFVGEFGAEARFNALQSAKAAGYSGNDNVLGVQGHRLLKNAKIRRAIDERLSALHAHMTSDEVLAQLGEIARAEWGKFLEVKIGNDGETVSAMLRLGDKLKALELIGKYHSLFDKVVEQRLTIILSEKAVGAYRRLREELAPAFPELTDTDLADFTARLFDVPVEMVVATNRAN